MSLPSCFQILNFGFFTNIESEIGSVNTAEELQAMVNRIFAEISLLESTITSQLSFLGPIEALLVAPESNPAAIVTWLTSFITDFLTPFLKPFLIYSAQLAQLAIEVAAITAAIEEIASLKFPTISISVPTISIGCTL